MIDTSTRDPNAVPRRRHDHPTASQVLRGNDQHIGQGWDKCQTPVSRVSPAPPPRPGCLRGRIEVRSKWTSERVACGRPASLPMNRKMKTKVVAILSTVAVIHAAGAAQPDVEMLPSGVRVEHLQRGSGARPNASSTVLVHYHGTLLDGTVFDSSVERKQPIAFPLRGVIPCWTQGVQQMNVGGKAVLTCPSRTAYGEAGAGSKIPPNATLKFEVQLLEIQ